MDIAGKWYGTLTYGNSYGDDSGKELIFEIDIHQDTVRFSGNSKDLHGFALNTYDAELVGELNGNAITFMKRYNGMNYTHTDFKSSEPGPEIIYKGNWDQTLKQFRGNWIIKEQYLRVNGQTYLLPKSEGTWFMKRA